MTQTGRLTIRQGRIEQCSVPFMVLHARAGSGDAPYLSDCPLLGLASHGDSHAEAVTSMTSLIEAYLEDLLDLGKLDTVLSRYGWARETGTSGDIAWVPPQVMSELAEVPKAR